MAASTGHDSRQYSWLWVSHISPKNSKWLQENLSDMDMKVKAMIKLINEDADSFARRAEMYYKKRPELMKQVEEFYRAYRALAERYDQATGALRQAHRTISEVFPNQMPSMDESPSSSGQEVEPHTPEMPTFSRPKFESDDHISKRNGSYPQETSALSNRKSLKQSTDLSLSGENVTRAVSDGKARKGLSFESPEVKGREDISTEMVNMQQEISRLVAENQNLKQQMSEFEQAKKAESEIQNQKDTVFHLNSEKDTSLLQYDQSTERLSTLESELSKAQTDLKKLTDEMASEVQKVNSAESRNSVIQSELEALDQKAKIQQQELEQKLKELENLQFSFQEEHEKRMQAESVLLSEGKEHAKSQEEVQRLIAEIKMTNEKLDELMQSKMNLESAVCELKKEVKSLTEQNHSYEVLIQELSDEINSLRDLKSELQNEIESLRGTISQVNTEKDGALLQYQQVVERVSMLESQLLNIQSELEFNENKVHMLMQDLEQKREEIKSVHGQLQVESHRRTQTEAALLTSESLHSKLEEEVKRLTQDLDTSIKKLSELENDKLDLENTSKELKNAISDVNSEMDAALLQHQQSLEKVSDLELQLSKAQLKLEKSEQKMHVLERDIAQMSESVNSLELSLEEETEKKVQAETSLMSMENIYSQSQEELSRLHREIEKLNGKSNELENLSSELRDTILLLNTEKDATLTKNQESLMRVSDLESELSKLQAELDKVEGRAEVLEKELQHKQEEVYSLETSLEDKTQKCIEGEAALLSVTGLHSESRDEVNKLAMDIEKLSGQLSEVENNKMDLENIVIKYTEDIHILREQNLSAEHTIKDLHCELDALKELNVKLKAEMGSHIGEKEAVQRDFVRQKEEKKNLEGTYHALAVDMDTLKGSAAANQKLIEDLQIANLKLKEVCANNLIEKALLSEKVQEMEQISDEYSLLEISISDANAEMESLRERIKALESSESSLRCELSERSAFSESSQFLGVSGKAVLVAELDTLGRSFADISEKNSVLEMSLSDMKAELEDLRLKLKDSEETRQAQLADNFALSAEKNNLVSQLQKITVVTKALESKHADLEGEHTSLSREKDLVYDQVRKLKGLLRTINKEYEYSVKSHEMHVSSLEEQISSLIQKIHDLDERLEEQEQKSMRASISVVVLEGSLVDVKDKNVALLEKCQKYAVENHAAEILISKLEDQARYHEAESKALLKHNGKLREGISQHMKVLNISRDVGPAEVAQDEILLQTVSDETSNIVKLKEESEDVNTLMYTELLVHATVMLQVGTEFRDLQLQKRALEKKVEDEATEMISLQNENCRLIECNEQLRQELQKKSERGQVQKTEALVLHEKLSCLTESYHSLQDEITDMTERSESLSKEHNSLIERYKALEDENGAILAECMILEHLSLFFRSHNNEVASALVSLTDEMALLTLGKGELDSEVKVLSARAMMLESENSNLKKYIVYLIEVLRNRLVLLEFELNTGKSVCQELFGELERCMAQLVHKDDELLEAEENVQLMQEKNRELCLVVAALQVAIESDKVVKGELEKKIVILTAEGTTKDDEMFLLRQANETLQVDACILKNKERHLTSAHELMSKKVEQHEREFALLVGDAITYSVNAAVYEEKALKFMMEAKAIEISAIAQKELLLNKTSSLDAHIEALQKKVNDMQEENAELRTKAGSRMEANEIYSENEKQKDAADSKGKQVQMMKDIELDQISTCPTYGTGIYPLGNAANAELDDEMLQLWEAAERTCKNQTAKSSSSEHDIQAVEEVKSEYPSSELVRGRELGINRFETSSSSLVEPHDIWGKNVVERLTSNAQRLLSIQESIQELKRKMGGPSKGRSPMNTEYEGISTQLHETEGLVLEQINLNSKLSKKAESYPALLDSINAEREGLPSRRKISEQVKKGSDNVARLELELQKIQYVLLKLEEENEYRRLKVSDKRTRVLLRDYLYGRKDHRGGAHKKKNSPFCGCVPSKSRTEP